MSDSERDYRSRNVVEAVLSNVWAIDERKLDQIRGFLEARANGVVLSEEEIQATIAPAKTREQILASLAADNWEPDERDDKRLIIDGIEVLQLYGTLGPRMNLMMSFSGGTSTQKFGQAFNRAMDDGDVSAVFIQVDSPGGVVSGTEELRQQIFSRRGQKRVVAVAEGIVASAAYYIASAADVLIATPSTDVGSIGVYMVTRDVTRAAEKAGIKFSVWRAGELKAAGIEYETLTEERAKVLQERVDAPYRQFVDSVAANRGVKPATVLDRFGQGAVFIADEALRRGMIDRVALMDTVFGEERRLVISQRKSTIVVPLMRAEPLPHAVASAVPAAALNLSSKEDDMNARIKAALYARGLIESADASDDICRAALAGVFGGVAKIPANDDETIKQLTGQAVVVATAAPVLDDSTTARLQKLHDREMEEARVEARNRERDRVAEIHARAAICRASGLDVTPEMVEAAIKSNDSANECAGAWMKNVKPQRGVDRTEATESEVDKFQTAAAESMADRYLTTSRVAANRPQLSPAARELRGCRLLDVAKKDCLIRGVNLRGSRTDEDAARTWLKNLDDGYGVPSALDGAAQTASQFPNLLSSLVGKMLDQAIELSDTTYQQWTGRLADVPDLKPKLIVAAGGLDQLDELADDDAKQQLRLVEETPGWIQIGRYGNSVALTPVMVANDDLDAFMTGINDLGMAHDRTLNMLCLNLVTGNVTCLDGYALYDDTYHLNYISSGAAPTAAEMSYQRLKHRKQRGINSVGYVATPPAIVLVPPALETTAEQTCISLQSVVEAVMKTTDATINLFRGKLTPVVEPELTASSEAVWYTFADPARRRTIVHAFQTGYGRGGQRNTWFDDARGTRYYGIEGRFAAAVAGYRGTVKNAGSGRS